MHDETMKRLESMFNALRKERKFKTTLEKLDSIFFIRDYVIHENFANQTLSRTICRRIVELYMSWYGYLHGIVMPNPGSMASMGESNFFNEDEKKECMRVMNKIMVHASTNSLIGLTKDKKQEAKFIDDSVAFWREVQPFLVKSMKQVNDGWKEKVAAPSMKRERDRTFG